MLKAAWDQIEHIYTLPNVDPKTISQFKLFKHSQPTHTKKEGNLSHYCSFFLPYSQKNNKIFLGYHKKANDWIPPGGHIEIGETPIQAGVREMYEELNTTIKPSDLIPWNLSIKHVNRPLVGCASHYDVWHLVNISIRDFNYDRHEYYDANWFELKEGISKIVKNPDFAHIISYLL